MRKSNDMLVNIQILRLVAAAMVLHHHIRHEIVDLRLPGWQSWEAMPHLAWGAGVDVFFVISGFVMILISGDAFGSAGAAFRFLRRRIVRVAPLYWVFTTLMLVAIFAFKGRVSHSTVDVAHVVASYGFLPWVDPKGAVHPVLGVGWTLNYEMFFYVVFAFALLFSKRVGLAVLFGTLTALVAVGLVLPERLSPQVLFWSRPIVLEFLFGCALALAYRRGLRLSMLPAILLMVVGLVGLAIAVRLGINEGPWRFVGAGLSGLAIAAGAALGPQLTDSGPTRLLHLGGDASYALYLSHPFSINICAIAWEKLRLGSAEGFAVATLLVALAASIAVHLLMEKPLLRLMGARIGPFLGPSRRG